ncbi:hypothetical protein KAR91_69055 [Candidatus Pacearchaeota archaeon]|nr:hypothetical protein [Candidatus Pacearchaeota archaeon]
MTYHNTTNIDGEELARAEMSASSQDKVVLEWFRLHRKGGPSNLASKFPWPITSIRRAISNLTKSGFLEKTELKQSGLYGKKEYIWKIHEGGQRELFSE